jgi:pyridinium-3,5-bisthiocarboxylic acid mononucleotide nickel chelatase
VYFTPIFMKKNRPATMLSVIAPRLHEPTLARILLEETTTFGMRVQPIGRYEAQREMRKVSTRYGDIDVKLKILDGRIAQAVPEYEICLRLSEQSGVPFLQVYQAALAAGQELTH